LRDARDSETDDLTEEWAQTIPPLPVEGGLVHVAVADAQARFNLNNLAVGGEGNAVAADIGVLRNLLALHELPPDLADAVLDWVDPDSVARPNGAEDLDYLSLEPPYRAANRPLASVDELLRVRGFTPEIVERLRPYVIALPAAGRVPVNVNTAPAPVLAALAGTSLAHAERIVEARRRRPFANPGEFQAALDGRRAAEGSYALRSGYFIVSVEARVGRTQRRTEALIERPAGGNADPLVHWYGQPPLEIILDEEDA
jgi:general secretion pathway protein K